MAPSPQERDHGPLIGPQGPLLGDEVVISGLSGVFPSSANTSEFKENLFNQLDMVTEADWDLDQPQTPRYVGKTSGMDKFDAQFFKIHFNQATCMEPISRKLLENAYSAMFDSGINPLAYRGKKVGVFVGSSFSDTSNASMYLASKSKGFVLSGCGKSMFANRISYWIDAKGPSYTIDGENVSSMVCLQHAYDSMTKGECEAAIVGGGNLCLDPYLGFNLRSGGWVSLDGKTRCFDKKADGYVRAEAVSVLFLQKAKDAKRIYAQLCHAEVKFGIGTDAHHLSIRKSAEIEEFLNEFYEHANVSSKQIEYVEAHGAATLKEDEEELRAISNVFSRENTVRVGCVKSNMGNSEPASGVCAITKVCLAYHEGKLPGNLHCTNPQDLVANNNKLQVVKGNEHFNRGYTAVNNFSALGMDCHVLMKGHYKPKKLDRYKAKIPRLVTVSGRHEEAVDKILNYIKNKPIDPEEIGMFHNIYTIETPGHMARGYIVVDTNEKNETVSLAQNSDFFPGSKRPLWLVFSGMGSQWPAMAADLMRIPVFAETIQRCHDALVPKGVNLIKVLTDPDKQIFDNILNCFIGIASVQIALTKVLKDIGLNPDYVIGHSQGEMGCAFFDDCFTVEEAILAAYSRGFVSLNTPFAKGKMAAVGLGYKDILPLLPPEIDVACHNSNESATISGPADEILKFIAELSAKGIFAREVPSGNIAFHSRYIAHAGKGFSEALQNIIKPKLRSEKWICTSIPQERWDEPLSKYSSPEFHTNNLMSPVYFEEAATLIPDNAVIVEVAPHALLQSILKKSHPECTHIGLTRRGETQQVKYLLEAIGKIYQAGYDVSLASLYPAIEFPVGTQTPLLSHLIEWEHSEIWPERIEQRESIKAPTRQILVSTHDDENEFLTGHVRDGINVLPESAILTYVWETLAMYKGVDFNKLSVIFRDVQFFIDAALKPEETLHLTLMINRGNERFEVSHNETLVTSGFITEAMKPKYEQLDINETTTSDFVLKSDDVYRILHSKGMSYRNEFQLVESANLTQNSAQIKWKNNWVTFLDSIFQFNLLKRDYDGISTPKIIKKLTINTDDHFLATSRVKENEIFLRAQYYDIQQVTRCAGVEFRYITFEDKMIKENAPDVIKSFSFVPHFITGIITDNVALRLILQVVAENISDNLVTIMEAVSYKSARISNVLKEIIESDPSFNIQVKTITIDDTKILYASNGTKKPNLLIVENLYGNNKNIEEIFRDLEEDIFILTLQENQLNVQHHKNCNVVLSTYIKDGMLLLLKKSKYSDKTIYINVDNEYRFSWVQRLQTALRTSNPITFISEKPPSNGLIGFVKKIKLEFKNKISLFIVEDNNAPKFNPENTVYSDQLKKNLVFNVLKKGKWGAYYYLPVNEVTNIEQFCLTSALPGDINRLVWKEKVNDPADDLIKVSYAGPSIRDVQKAVGAVETADNTFGMDYSGIDRRGNKVMGLIAEGAIANTVRPEPDLLWPVPSHWTLEEAATVPLPYVHAYYILTVLCTLKSGHTVFVNGGAGALGQAIISICLALECTVYTSVRSLEKKNLLLRLFPTLKEEHIGSSRNGDFYFMIMNSAKRCDFVINSENGDSRKAAMKCVNVLGIFVDVGCYDMTQNQAFGMEYLVDERSYKSIQLDNLFKPENFEERKIIQNGIAQGITTGVVRPLTRVVYPTSEITRAFRLLSTNRHRGRVLVRIDDANRNLNLVPRIKCSSHQSCIIICDETNLGIDLSDRLVKRGARSLILNTRSKFITGYLQFKLASWSKLKVTVKISTDNLQSEANCVRLLQEGEKFGQVQGIYIIQEKHIEDGISEKALKSAVDNTVSVIANLDLLSRKNCPVLSDFVVIMRPSNSITDEYAISATEKICRDRSETGLPALALRLEFLDELNTSSKPETNLRPQSINTALNALEISLKQTYSNVLTYNVSIPQTEFLNKVMDILGIKSLVSIDENSSISDFEVNAFNLEEIRAVIKSTLGIDYCADAIARLTISNLKHLNRTNVRIAQNTKSGIGLGAFYNFIDNDEYAASDPLIPMRGRISGNEHSVNGKVTNIWLIPGFEGHSHIFGSLTERLKIPAVTLQLGPDMNHESITEIAASLKDLILKRFEEKPKFYLLGYSFGVNVALELAALLEKEGRIGVVFCLDSSPDALKVQLDAYLGKLTETQLQNSIIKHMFTVMTERDSSEIEQDLLDVSDWTSKVDICLNRSKKHATFTLQYTRYVLEAALARIKLAKEYKPDFKLRSELILIKGIPHPKAETLPNDYNLSKYSVQRVKVYNIESEHITAVQNSRIPNIVNKHLDPRLLQEFKKMNLCDTYIYSNT